MRPVGPLIEGTISARRRIRSAQSDKFGSPRQMWGDVDPRNPGCFVPGGVHHRHRLQAGRPPAGLDRDLVEHLGRTLRQSDTVTFSVEAPARKLRGRGSFNNPRYDTLTPHP
jgi:hypothetical protein